MWPKKEFCCLSVLILASCDGGTKSLLDTDATDSSLALPSATDASDALSDVGFVGPGTAASPSDETRASEAQTTVVSDAGLGPDAKDGPPQVSVVPRMNHYFPAGSFMYQSVVGEPVEPTSALTMQWLADQDGFASGLAIDFSTDVFVAQGDTQSWPFRTPVSNYWAPDCDTSAFPVPVAATTLLLTPPCDGDQGCLLLVVDPMAHLLYEMLDAHLAPDSLQGGCAAVWDLSRLYGPEGRGEQCTSADAAGFAIAPLLLTADEVKAGVVEHALRFVLPTRLARSGVYRHPGNHAGSPSGPDEAPSYGSRFRLRADYELATLPSEGARVVARALQTYGMVMSEGWSAAISAQTDRTTAAKWSGLLVAEDLRGLRPQDFEIFQTGAPIPLTYECTRTPVSQAPSPVAQ